jgi:hypothetical protein
MLIEKIALRMQFVCRPLAAALRKLGALSSRRRTFVVVMDHLQHIRSSGPYNREEMNER